MNPSAKLGGYRALIKPRQTMLLLATGVAGYVSARPWNTRARSSVLTEAVMMAVSLFAAIGGTTALNMVLDRDIDARMSRTAHRPVPRGLVSAREAALLGGGLTTVGLAAAFWLGRPFGAVVTVGALIDLLVYSAWLKRRSPWSILLGGVAGGMPILAGRTLGVGRVDGLGVLLALSVLLWIPSHVVTLAMAYAEDYRRSDVPTWPNAYGFGSARHFVAVCNALQGAALVGAGYCLGISRYSLGLVGSSGTAMFVLSLWAVQRPSADLNYTLFRATSFHMLASMTLITLGAALWQG